MEVLKSLEGGNSMAEDSPMDRRVFLAGGIKPSHRPWVKITGRPGFRPYLSGDSLTGAVGQPGKTACG